MTTAKKMGLQARELREVPTAVEELLRAVFHLSRAWTEQWLGLPAQAQTSQALVVDALKALFATAELQKHRDMGLRVLRAAVPDGPGARMLLEAMWPPKWKPTLGTKSPATDWAEALRREQERILKSRR